MLDFVFKAVMASMIGSTFFLVAVVVGHWFYFTEKKGEV